MPNAHPLKPDDSGGAGAQRMLLGWLLRQGRPAGPWIALCAALGIAGGFLLVAQAALIAGIVHRTAVDGAGREALAPLFLAAVGVVCARAGLSWARDSAGFAAGARVRAQVRAALVDRLFDLGPVRTAGRSSGELAAAVLDRVEALHNFFSLYLPQLVVAAAVPGIIAAFVFPVSWAAAGLLVLTAPVIPLFMVLVGMGAESVSQKHFTALGRLSAHFLDVLQGLSTLKLFGRSRGEAAHLSRSSEQYRRRTMSVLRIAFLSSAVLEFFASISIALVAVYLGLTYLGYLDFGLWGRPLQLADGLFILLLAPDFYSPLRELGTHYHARAEAVGAAAEIQQILAARAPAFPPADVGAAFSGTIRFEAVCFGYGAGDRPVLDGVDFHLQRGRRTLMIGGSGEGKSTILHLLLGFVRASGGRIRIDGRQIDSLDPVRWRHLTAWIGQEPALFFGTIRENIRLGRPNATDAQVEAAAAAARVNEFSARLAGGLDARVEEFGKNLSRGQAQRIAVARAFVKDAPVLLLDEPTAGLDAENEQMVAGALASLCRNRTVLWVTHRLDIAAPDDQVLILKDGRVKAAAPGDVTGGSV